MAWGSKNGERVKVGTAVWEVLHEEALGHSFGNVPDRSILTVLPTPRGPAFSFFPVIFSISRVAFWVAHLSKPVFDPPYLQPKIVTLPAQSSLPLPPPRAGT